MQICFFEDEYLSHFHPLTLTRPIDNLRIGIFTLAEKWRYALNPSSSTRLLRSELKGVFDQPEISSDRPCYWINSRFLPESSLIKKINRLRPGDGIREKSGTVIAACRSGSATLASFNNHDWNFDDIRFTTLESSPSVNHIWDLFLINGNEIERDLKYLNPSQNQNEGKISDHAILEHSGNIFIEKGAVIEPGAVLIAGDGPIYIGKNAHVMTGAKIRGPVAVCHDAIVKMGAKIYEKTTIGPVCKVGGEIKNAIFHSYTNKSHEGFVGNSVIGQWCNFGADTNVSNLKNNYGTIRLPDWETGEIINTGQQFIGTIMGDHSKTAINTMMNTGTICGVSCNIFDNGFPPKLIPSFSWLGNGQMQNYKFDKAIETMRTMMHRRNISLNSAYISMMKRISENSKKDEI